MSGLRERNRVATRERILSVASRMFSEDGYEATRIEDIAEAADLSVGTFYNYFTSKADIVLSTVSLEVEDVLAAGEITLGGPHESTKEAVDELTGGYFKNTFASAPREIWRIAIARMIIDPQTEFSKHYIDLDGRLSDQVCRCIASLQAEGLVQRHLDAKAIGELIFNNLNMRFIEYVRSNNETADEVTSEVERINAPLLALISPNT